jgi:hypothetical protein
MDHDLQEGLGRALHGEDGHARSRASPDDPSHGAQCRCGGHVEPSTTSRPTLSVGGAEPLRAEIAATSAPTSPAVLILGAGAVAELVLPWALIGLSDLFLFDTPTWSVWTAFASPPAITLAALLTYHALKRRALAH